MGGNVMGASLHEVPFPSVRSHFLSNKVAEPLSLTNQVCLEL